MIPKMSLVLAGLLAVCIISEYGVAGATTPREPSIQAYGLPKRFLTGNNGHIERIHTGEQRVQSEDSSHRGHSASSVVRRNFKRRTPINSHDDTGTIEVFHSVSTPRRQIRSTSGEDEFNAANDLQAEESKIFRPLFVYRQQVVAKERRQRSQRERRNNAASARNYKNSPRLYYYSQSG